MTRVLDILLCPEMHPFQVLPFSNCRTEIYDRCCIPTGEPFGYVQSPSIWQLQAQLFSEPESVPLRPHLNACRSKIAPNRNQRKPPRRKIRRPSGRGRFLVYSTNFFSLTE